MSQRHTATSPEQRNMPISGRWRNAVRLAYVDRIINENTGELMYAEVKDAEGEIIQQRANRATRRKAAWSTRLHGAPRMQLRQLPVEPRSKPRPITTEEVPVVKDEWLDTLELAAH